MASVRSARCLPRSMAARACGMPTGCGGATPFGGCTAGVRPCGSRGGASSPRLLVLLVPVAVLALGLLVFGAALVLETLGSGTAGRVASGYTALVAAAFGPAGLPIWLPRLALLIVLLLGGAIVVAAVVNTQRLPARRRQRGGFWWAALAAPMGDGGAAAYFRAGLWELIRGGAKIRQPETKDLARRYAELLADNLGQPGFPRAADRGARPRRAARPRVRAARPGRAAFVLSRGSRRRRRAPVGRSVRSRRAWPATRACPRSPARWRSPASRSRRSSCSPPRATGAAKRTGCAIDRARSDACSRRSRRRACARSSSSPRRPSWRDHMRSARAAPHRGRAWGIFSRRRRPPACATACSPPAAGSTRCS